MAKAIEPCPADDGTQAAAEALHRYWRNRARRNRYAWLNGVYFGQLGKPWDDLAKDLEIARLHASNYGFLARMRAEGMLVRYDIAWLNGVRGRLPGQMEDHLHD